MSKQLKFIVFILIAFGVSCSLSKGFRTSAVPTKEKHYVIIGCSAAGFSAAKELVKLGQGGRVTCISEEKSNPYNKTQFHAYIAKKGRRSSRVELAKGTPTDIEFMLGTKVIAINSSDKTVHFADERILQYDKLLIATGARSQIPAHLSTLVPSSRIRFYNTKEDLDALLTAADTNPSLHIAIIGAGIRSLELSDGLKQRNKQIKVSILNRSAQFFGELGDTRSDEFISKRLKTAGVNFIAPASISDISEHGHQVSIKYEHGELLADWVVFAMGTVPNSELAKTAHVELYDDGSIKVDSELRTSNSDIFAAGDVVGFKNPLGEGWVRSAKWRSSKQQGQIAAANMVGQHRMYKHEPAAFVTSFFGVKALLSGVVRSQPLSTSVIKSEEKRYVRYVLENGRLKAFISVWDKDQKRPNVFLLRRKLVEQSPVSPDELLR